ncbi:porin [Undibacterium sp. RuTC16W]|uniref:porin n=1 Tax=Undibacterium sp. RuTC16W TaxID=3413048 RepID=UPI003BEFF570
MLDLIARRCFTAFCLLAVSLPAFAEDGDKPSFSLSGFGTLGAVYNSNRQADFIRDLLQPEGVGYTRKLDFGVDSLLGLQLTAAPLDNLDATLQVVSRRSQTGFNPEITWAFARYTPNDNIQFRAGRLGFDVYLLADSRNVAYSYLWVRPPVDYFGSIIVSYIDGTDLVLKYPLGNGVARIKTFAGKAREKSSTGGPDEYFSLNGSDVLGAHLEYQTQSWSYRLGYSQLRFKNEFPGLPALINGLRDPAILALSPQAGKVANEIGFQDKTIKYYSAGLAYDEGPLQAQFMLSSTKSDTLGFPGYAAGYATVGYRTGKWTHYATYSEARPLHRDSDGSTGLPAGVNPYVDAIIAGSYNVAHSSLNEQTTISLGMRYDLTDKADLKIQLDHINNKQRLLVRNQQPGWDGKATLLSVSVNFIF